MEFLIKLLLDSNNYYGKEQMNYEYNSEYYKYNKNNSEFVIKILSDSINYYNVMIAICCTRWRQCGTEKIKEEGEEK